MPKKKTLTVNNVVHLDEELKKTVTEEQKEALRRKFKADVVDTFKASEEIVVYTEYNGIGPQPPKKPTKTPVKQKA